MKTTLAVNRAEVEFESKIFQFFVKTTLKKPTLDVVFSKNTKSQTLYLNDLINKNSILLLWNSFCVDCGRIVHNFFCFLFLLTFYFNNIVIFEKSFAPNMLNNNIYYSFIYLSTLYFSTIYFTVWWLNICVIIFIYSSFFYQWFYQLFLSIIYLTFISHSILYYFCTVSSN